MCRSVIAPHILLCALGARFFGLIVGHPWLPVPSYKGTPSPPTVGKCRGRGAKKH